MSATRWDDRFFETTKGRVLALLRRGSRTVDELASALGVTDNAIRIHIAARMTPEELEALLREVGCRLATTKGPSRGSVRTRAEAAATVLTELGGVVDIEENE